MQTRFLETFKAARRVGTPLIAVQTPDPAATIAGLKTAAIAATSAIEVWDICRGWQAGNQPGQDAMAEALEGAEPSAATSNPVESLMLAHKLPAKTVLFALQGNRYLREDNSPASAAFAQAVWNLRDAFKADFRTLVLLGPQFTLPADVANDVLVLDEPLPTDTELEGVVREVMESAELTPNGETAAAVDALRGLAAFPAEQAVAMSVSPDGLDVTGLWERKRKMIEQTPGLAVWTGGETLDGVGGNANVKGFVRKLLAGREAPRAVVFIDEIEKMLAGATGVGDSSGVSQGQLQQLLTFMQDRGSSGMIFVGPPGAGKSAVAKAIGAEAGIPTVALDLGGMKASLVGESEQRLRQALKVVDAVSGGRALFVATCNKIGTLPPELRRRFTMGTFFFDLPDAEERATIWSIYRKVFQLAEQRLPADEGWTGAEIRQAALLAYRLNLALADTPDFIVPVAKSAAEEIEALRRQADRRFLSASRPGVYRREADTAAAAPQTPRRRAIAGQEV